ncbi:hypothetical protein PRNP1_010102 [Phytophthora ramorum]
MCQALTCEVAALKGHLQKKQDDWAREAGVGRDENKELRVDKEIKKNVFEEGSTLVIVQAIVEVGVASLQPKDVVLVVLFDEATASSAADVVKTPIDSLITVKLAELQFDDKFFRTPRRCST